MKVQADSHYVTVCPQLSDSSLYTGCYSCHGFTCHAKEQLQPCVLSATTRDMLVGTTLPMPLVTLAFRTSHVEAGPLVLRACSADSESL